MRPLTPFDVTTSNGTRTWFAEDAAHAREQHEDAHGAEPGETILSITPADRLPHAKSAAE